jgi:hypothetical protein
MTSLASMPTSLPVICRIPKSQSVGALGPTRGSITTAAAGRTIVHTRVSRCTSESGHQTTVSRLSWAGVSVFHNMISMQCKARTSLQQQCSRTSLPGHLRKAPCVVRRVLQRDDAFHDGRTTDELLSDQASALARSLSGKQCAAASNLMILSHRTNLASPVMAWPLAVNGTRCRSDCTLPYVGSVEPADLSKLTGRECKGTHMILAADNSLAAWKRLDDKVSGHAERRGVSKLCGW